MSRINSNFYVSKLQNIFSVWADYIKREKNAINVIGAIARRNLRMEVFTRIRLVARERQMEGNAEKVLEKFGRLWKQTWVRQAFSRWRIVTYSEVVKDMEEKK